MAIAEPDSNNYLHNGVFTLVAGIWLIIAYFILSNFVFTGLISDIFVLPSTAIVTMVSHPSWIVGIITFSYSIWVSNARHYSIGMSSTMINLYISFILLAVTFFSEVSNVLITFGYISAEVAYLQLVINLFIFVLAIFLKIVNYLSNNEHHFYLPYTVLDIIIYAQNGLPVFTKQFLHPDGIKRKIGLISAVFSAISLLLKESLGEEANLNTISLSGYEVLFIPLNDETTTLTIITSKGNYFLIQGMMRFKSLISDNLLKKLNAPAIDNMTELENTISDLLKKSMPFIKFDDTSNSETEKFQHLI